MIGPGTGVAPFIGFLQERELLRERHCHDRKISETWLLFGCQDKEMDFIFRYVRRQAYFCMCFVWLLVKWFVVFDYSPDELMIDDHVVV